ncbi:UvrABC system protein B [Bienertia sinuspersici]
MQMGWEIEKHLKSRVNDLQRKRIVSDRLIVEALEGISSIRENHSQQKTYIMKLLDDEKSYLQSVVSSIQEKIGKLPKEIRSAELQVTASNVPNAPLMVNSSEVLSQALQEKVSALLLLSQQEERHLFEKNVQATLQETLDELQRTLQLVTQEKVNALVELAEVKREYQLLQEKTTEEVSRHSSLGERRIVASERDGRLKNFLKRSSLKRWLGTEENSPPIAHPNLEAEQYLNRGSNHSMNDARLRIEIATLKESMQNLERLTSDIRKLRVSLIQHNKVLDEIIREAEMVKTALSAALPLSWSGDGDVASSSEIVEENSNHGDSNTAKMDSVSAAGIEMVELLILAAQIMKKKEKKIRRRSEESTNYSENIDFKQQ